MKRRKRDTKVCIYTQIVCECMDKLSTTNKEEIPTAVPILVSVADGGIFNFLLVFLISLVPGCHLSGCVLHDNVL